MDFTEYTHSREELFVLVELYKAIDIVHKILKKKTGFYEKG